MIQFFDTLSSFIDKIQQFFHVIWERILDAWETIQLASAFFPPALGTVIITGFILIIILRVIGR